MNVWNKVFLGIIIVTSIVVVMLASVTYEIRTRGQKYTAEKVKQIDETNGKITKIRAGGAPSKASVDKSPSEWGYEELRGRVLERYRERGSVWTGSIVASMDERTLPPALQQVLAQIIITEPFVQNESGIETDVVKPDTLKGVVYVFAESDASGDAGAFLGRFNVESEPTPTKFRGGEGDEKNGFQITLITVDPISSAEVEKIFNAAKFRWSICLTPPFDQVAGIFDQLTDEEKQMIPEELREAFQNRPMPALSEEEKAGVAPDVIALWESIRKTVDDPENEWAQDFSLLLDWLYRQRSVIQWEIKVAESDIKTFEAAETKIKAENVKLTEDCELEDKRRVAMEVQRDHIKKTWDDYNKEIDRLNLQIEKLQAMSAAYVKKITEYQLQIIEKIEGQEEARSQETGVGSQELEVRR